MNTKIKMPNIDFADSLRYAILGHEQIKFNNDIPRKYIIKDEATILFWGDGTKTIVKRSKDDEYNKKLGFLTAYFQKHSGMSKTQANKYLDSLISEEQKVAVKMFADGTFSKTMGNLCDGMSDMFKNMSKAFKGE